jgi:hypothetical protein
MSRVNNQAAVQYTVKNSLPNLRRCDRVRYTRYACIFARYSVKGGGPGCPWRARAVPPAADVRPRARNRRRRGGSRPRRTAPRGRCEIVAQQIAHPHGISAGCLRCRGLRPREPHAPAAYQGAQRLWNRHYRAQIRAGADHDDTAGLMQPPHCSPQSLRRAQHRMLLGDIVGADQDHRGIRWRPGHEHRIHLPRKHFRGGSGNGPGAQPDSPPTRLGQPTRDPHPRHLLDAGAADSRRGRIAENHQMHVESHLAAPYFGRQAPGRVHPVRLRRLRRIPPDHRPRRLCLRHQQPIRRPSHGPAPDPATTVAALVTASVRHVRAMSNDLPAARPTCVRPVAVRYRRSPLIGFPATGCDKSFGANRDEWRRWCCRPLYAGHDLRFRLRIWCRICPTQASPDRGGPLTS